MLDGTSFRCQAYKQISGWTKAVQKARKELRITGQRGHSFRTPFSPDVLLIAVQGRLCAFQCL